ncbi:MAG: hypothetical protein U1E60_11115 [Reyranellaceae bacterium]
MISDDDVVRYVRLSQMDCGCPGRTMSRAAGRAPPSGALPALFRYNTPTLVGELQGLEAVDGEAVGQGADGDRPVAPLLRARGIGALATSAVTT